jgi:hypothetical protein
VIVSLLGSSPGKRRAPATPNGTTQFLIELLIANDSQFQYQRYCD